MNRSRAGRPLGPGLAAPRSPAPRRRALGRPGLHQHGHNTHRAALPAIAAVAVLAMVVSACSSSSSSGGGSGSTSGALTASAPGITSTTITIGSHQPLTGVAAPGYDEIAPASNAYFAYVNAHGGVYGRKIVYKYLDDKYDPTQTVSVVKQLVLQDSVYAIFDGLGTPTHLAVAPYLNSQKVPDVFVASGCECWNAPGTSPQTFGWQLDYVREGKILGSYLKQHFAGQKIGYFYQNDEFGQDGVKGLDAMIPKADVVSRQSYDPTNINVGPQVAALKASGAKVIVSFSVPAFTALLKLNSLKLGFSPTFAVSDVGSDPITLAGLLQAYAKQGGATVSGNQLTQGIITDGYLPSLGDTGNSWVALLAKIHNQYLPKLPFDGNVAFGEAVAYTFVQAMLKAGKNPTRADLVTAIQGGLPQGPAVAPYAYSAAVHAGMTGAYIGVIKNGVIAQQGPVLVTDTSPAGAVTSYTAAAPTAPANGMP
jgi:ABC-type branched-subunit amino acid transport system substrate-binding protein